MKIVHFWWFHFLCRVDLSDSPSRLVPQAVAAKPFLAVLAETSDTGLRIGFPAGLHRSITSATPGSPVDQTKWLVLRMIHGARIPRSYQGAGKVWSAWTSWAMV